VTTLQSQQQLLLDYETSLRCLCQEHLHFESYFGSEQSYTHASKAVPRKLTEAYAEQQQQQQQQQDRIYQQAEATSTTNPLTLERKRKAEDDINEVDMDVRGDAYNEPATKKPKTQDEDNDGNATETSKPLAQLSIKTDKPKVHVGNLKYPAHPFTVRVCLQTEDMDLVDTFRSKCGAIGHAQLKGSCNDEQGSDFSKESDEFSDDDAKNSVDLVDTTVNNAVKKTVATFSPLFVEAFGQFTMNGTSLLVIDMPLGIIFPQIKLFYDAHVTF
jgi:hypothetical protein